MIAMTIEMMAQIAVIRAKSSMYVTIAHHLLTEAAVRRWWQHPVRSTANIVTDGQKKSNRIFSEIAVPHSRGAAVLFFAEKRQNGKDADNCPCELRGKPLG